MDQFFLTTIFWVKLFMDQKSWTQNFFWHRIFLGFNLFSPNFLPQCIYSNFINEPVSKVVEKLIAIMNCDFPMRKTIDKTILTYLKKNHRVHRDCIIQSHSSNSNSLTKIPSFTRHSS